MVIKLGGLHHGVPAMDVRLVWTHRDGHQSNAVWLAQACYFFAKFHDGNDIGWYSK